jgi:hypothetical protein
MFIGISFAAEVCSSLSDKAVARNDLDKGERLAVLASKLCPFNHVYRYSLADIYAKMALPDSGEALNLLRKSEEFYKKSAYLNPIDGWSWIGLADVR